MPSRNVQHNPAYQQATTPTGGVSYYRPTVSSAGAPTGPGWVQVPGPGGESRWIYNPEVYENRDQYDMVSMPDGTVQFKKKPNFLTNYGPQLMAAGMGAGALYNAAAAGAFGGSAAASGGTTTVIPGTGIPVVSGTGPGLVAPTAVASTPSIVQQLRNAFTGPNAIRNAAGLAALLPMLGNLGGGGGGSDSPFGDPAIEDEIRQMLALQRRRIEQTQPSLDTLVNMAYGMSPTRYRGTPPAGYTPSNGPEGAYRYETPRFGDRG